MTQSLEERTDASLAEMDAEDVHITHLKQLSGCYYSYITVATRNQEPYHHIRRMISHIYLEGADKHLTGSSLDDLIVQQFAKSGAGASPCHARDNFSRKRGRIIAKGRLLKHIKAVQNNV